MLGRERYDLLREVEALSTMADTIKVARQLVESGIPDSLDLYLAQVVNRRDLLRLQLEDWLVDEDGGEP